MVTGEPSPAVKPATVPQQNISNILRDSETVLPVLIVDAKTAAAFCAAVGVPAGIAVNVLVAFSQTAVGTFDRFEAVANVVWGIQIIPSIL
jgi:hypothetical protein